MWGGSIRENKFLIFWLACLEVAVSLHVMRPTSSDARLLVAGERCKGQTKGKRLKINILPTTGPNHSIFL